MTGCCESFKTVCIIYFMLAIFSLPGWASVVFGTIFFGITDEKKSSDITDKNYCADDVYIMFGIDVFVSWGFIVYFIFGAICGSKNKAEDVEDTSMVVQTISVSYFIYYETKESYTIEE